VRYSYVAEPLPLDLYQTVYAAVPGSVEMPSAGRPLSWEVLGAARKRGVGIATLRHGKDFLSDNPGFTSLDQLAEARQVQRETGRIYAVCYSERFQNQATVRAGEVFTLLGPVGSGKTTLLRLLAGRDRPMRGSAALGIGVRPAYFAQDQAEHLDPSNTVFDEVYQAAPASWDIQAVRDLLGRFLFSGDGQFKSVATLSGGERSRVALAKLLLRPNNLLLLDEPTNHLDIASRERLEDTLSGYTGTLIVATHDRFLVNRLATKVIEVVGGGLRLYPGTYADYQRARAAAASTANVPDEASSARVAPVVSPADGDPAARRRLAADLREAERAVTLAEERLRAVEAALSDPGSYYGDLAALANEHSVVLTEVERLTERWAELAETAEGAA